MIRSYFRRRREDARQRVLAAVREGNGMSGFYIGWYARLGAGRVKVALYELEASGQIVARWEDLPPNAERPPRRLYFALEVAP